MIRRNPSARGFTLLEMLVATAMVVVLAGALYAALYTAFKARNTALAAVDVVHANDQALEIVSADLQAAVVPNGLLCGPFVGAGDSSAAGPTDNTLSFYSAIADIEPVPGACDIKRIDYALDSSAGGQGASLVRRVTSNLLATQTPEPTQEVVCRNVASFIVRYFDGESWQETWDSTTVNNALPLAVEVTIQTAATPKQPGSTLTRVVTLPCGVDSSASASTGGMP